MLNRSPDNLPEKLFSVTTLSVDRLARGQFEE